MENPSRKGILELLRKSHRTQYVVPVYQRNYTWTATKEVKQYLEDLKSVLVGAYSSHFLGIIIYLDKPVEITFKEQSLIDGQQRLTTIFLTLYAIKYLYIESGNSDMAEEIDYEFLINEHVSERWKFRLKPQVSDDDDYLKIVNNQLNQLKNSSSNIYKNFLYIKQEIKKFTELEEGYTLKDVLDALEKLYLVCIPILSEDSPQKIFESINSTGAKLSASDLIRNFVLMDIESELQEELYRKYCKRLEDLLTTDSKKIESFFRFYLANKQKYLTNSTSIYKSFKDWFYVENVNKPIEDILKNIIMYAEYYYNIYISPFDQLDKTIVGSIREFRTNSSDMPAPFLMEIYHLYDTFNEDGNRLVTAPQFNQILSLLNTYLIRRSICGLDTSDITRLFPILLKDVLNECSGDYSKIVDLTKKNLVNKQRGKSAYMPDDTQLRNLVKYANVYNLRAPLKVILYKIESYNNPATVDVSKLSIEHLMPQTPTPDWLNYLKVDQSTYDNNLHRLGNLTLASKVDNSKMQNKPFNYKQAILKDTSHLKINEEILNIDGWSIEEIDKRTDRLIDKIIKLYPYQSASDEFITKIEIYLNQGRIQAMGFFYKEDGSVEVLDGSEIVKYEDEKKTDEYERLLEDGIIEETDKGAVFVKPYTFTSSRSKSSALSAAAVFILGGSKNGWDYWKDLSGKSLSTHKDLKKEFQN